MSIMHRNQRLCGARWTHHAPGAVAPSNSSESLARSRPADHQPNLARFILDGTMLPCVTDTLPVAEAFRAALMSQFERVCRGTPHAAGAYQRRDRPELFASPVLAGKDADGQRGLGHAHAYYLPTAEGQGRRIDHLTVHAAGGFGAAEAAALSAIRELRWPGGTLAVRLIGLAQPSDFRAPLLGPARVWVSATPFVACRYPKRNGTKRDRPKTYATARDFAEHVLREELDRLRDRLRQHGSDLPAVERVGGLESCGGCQPIHPLEFKRCRQKPGDDGHRRPTTAFRITFAAPLEGPLCLGHSCHFGLGLFVPGKEG